MYSRTFYDGMVSTRREKGEKNPESVVYLVRYAWSGSQRYGALVWSGDIHSSYEEFRKQICAGIPWWTTDIGGFGVSKHETVQRREHDGVNQEDNWVRENEDSGLFSLVEKMEYGFATILDGLDEMSVNNMNNEIKEIINECGGSVRSFFKYSLFIIKKLK